jgi:hypothetical protein
MQRTVLRAAALAFGLYADPADGAPKDLVLIHTGTLPIVLTALGNARRITSPSRGPSRRGNRQSLGSHEQPRRRELRGLEPHARAGGMRLREPSRPRNG